MSTFNTADFMKTGFKERVTSYPVPELKHFFEDGKSPVWKVRGMIGDEVARANAAVDKNSMFVAVISALNGGSENEKATAIQDLLGVNKTEVPAEIVRRKEMLVACSVDPVCSEELAVKLASAYPTVFYGLTQEITKLTGLGQDPGKQKPSGVSKTSKPV